MNDEQQVGWIVEAVVKPDKMDALKKLSEEMVTSTQQNEAGTLTYDWHFNEHSNEVTIIERYANSEAAMIHINTFAEKFSDRFFEVLDQNRLLVYGNPNEEVRQALMNGGGTFTSPIHGFRR